MERKIRSEYLYLPDDCWERVFKFVNNDDNDNKNRYMLKSISTVSKYFFSVTNRLRLSLTILNATTPFLTSLLFHRFTNLTSLDLTHFQGDLDSLLSQIPPLKYLTSLNLSHQPSLPSYGLRAFSEQITTLTCLISTNLHSSFDHTHLFLIADCFPLLEELNLDYAKTIDNKNTGYIHGIEALSLSLIKLRKLNLEYHYYIDNKCVYYLFKNCKFLEELHGCLPVPAFVSAFCEHKPTMFKTLLFPIMFTPQIINSFKNFTCIDFSNFVTISDEILSSIAIADIPLTRIVLRNTRGYSYAGLFNLLSSKHSQSIQHLDLVCYNLLNDHRVVELSSFLVGLVSINLGNSKMLTYSSLFALLTKCPSLNQIKMANIGRRSVDDDYWIKGDFRVYPQLNSLYLPNNSWLGNKHIKMFAYVFPNLCLLDLRGCNRISTRSMLHVLRRFPKISHLNVESCAIYYKISSQRMIFQVPNLKILDLAFTSVNDAILYTISKTCSGLLQLSLTKCYECTEIGVKHVIENCTQLKEIDLRGCTSVHTNVFASMLFLKSLRKITAAPPFHFTETQRKLFLLQGCILC